MACPFFMPDQRIAADWPFPHRLPLGGAWNGTCTAARQTSPPAERDLKACNVGYARDCAILPPNRQADAVRFAIGEERDGLLHIRFAYEREYLPAGHGELLYQIASREWQSSHLDACLQKMADCYVESQLARRSKRDVATAEPLPVNNSE